MFEMITEDTPTIHHGATSPLPGHKDDRVADYDGRCPECGGREILQKETRALSIEHRPLPGFEEFALSWLDTNFPCRVEMERGCLDPECDAIWVEFWLCKPNFTKLTVPSRYRDNG